MFSSFPLEHSEYIRNLGVIIDLNLKFQHYNITNTKTALYHLKNTAKLKTSCPTLTRQNWCMHLSRLDYCDALVAGLPITTIGRFPLIQNSAPLLKTLHWQPIANSIEFISMYYCLLQGPKWHGS